MEDRFNSIEHDAIGEISSTQNNEDLDQIKIKYLGRKGLISDLFKELGRLSQDERPGFGQKINKLKQTLDNRIKERNSTFHSSQKTTTEAELDITMPGAEQKIGKCHPITKTLNDICAIFSHMGFAIIYGPEIENEYNNFEALNIPRDHPSRDAFDTFYIKDEWLLRSHTSPVQIRYMQRHKPPFAIVVPGKVFRPDAVDASHSFMFHQVEGLLVSKDTSFKHLKWALFEFAKRYFGSSTKVRFRPHFFPFTEPSAEVDVSCIICGGEGCRVCSRKGWLEILGAGMVDPNVFKAVGVDAEKYSGFAFGMGIERIAMLKYGIDDIRLFFENDLRFLEQF